MTQRSERDPDQTEVFRSLGLCDHFSGPRCARPVLDKLPTALLVTDRHGQIRLANARAGRLLAKPVMELMGASIDGVLAPLALLRQRCTDDERCELSIELPGRMLVVGYALSPVGGLLWDDRDEQYAITFQDITRVAELREERDRLLSISAISEAVPTLLHELKNPFAAVMSAMEVLGLDAPDQATRESVDAILAQLDRMRLVLDGFSLGHRQLRSGRHTRIDRELQQTFELLRKHAGASSVHTKAEIDEMPPLPLDAVVVRAIAFNLFLNAIDACWEGGAVKLSARLSPVVGEDGGAGGEERVFEMVVADTGAGMSADVLTRCREVFFTTKTKGSGIGLALCQRAVDNAGGSLRIQSREGEGTSVSIRVGCKPHG
jgi:nitrogen-specific signal transduction histidine kinase